MHKIYMPTPLTICTYNLQSAVATTKGIWQYPFTIWKYWLPHSDAPLEKAGLMMKREGVDIAFLVEVSGPSLQSGHKIQNDIVGNSAGLKERLFYSMKKPFRVTQEGLGLISRYPLSNPKIHPLKRGILTWYLGEATMDVNGRQVTLFVAHMALGPKVRAKQFKEMVEIIKDRKGPIVLAGDFNESEEEPFNMLLRETPLTQSCSVKSFPAWKPRHAFDRILLSKEFKVIEQYTPSGELVSDHLPYIVKAELE